jgi:glycosyltransferase involved in cell wall biosynthesis
MVTHEKTGLVFEKGNVEGLTNALRRLLVDTELRKTLGKNGREWVLRERSWAATTKVVAAYVRALSHGTDQAIMPPW